MYGIRLIAALSMLGVAACSSAGPPLRKHTIVAVGHGDARAPLPGVRLWLDGTRVGETGSRGKLRFTWLGRDGARVAVRAECPSGFGDPQVRDHLSLRAFDPLAAREASGSDSEPGALSLRIVCHANEHAFVVAVRTGQPDIPILHEAQELGRTNALGVAHVQLTVPRASDFRLTLDTSKTPQLRPKSPSKTFAPDHSAQYALWDQPLERPPPVVKRRPRAPPAERLR